MTQITDINSYEPQDDGNLIVGAPAMIRSEIDFYGKNNILFCEDGVKLSDSKIIFNASNSVVYLKKSSKVYNIALALYNNNAAYFGRDNYFNRRPVIILSEAKHFIWGDGGLISFGIWARTADPHLIYDIESRGRKNFSKSIFVGDHVWVGQNALLLKGTQIHSGTVIAANSVLSNKRVPSNTVYGGVPAKQIDRNIFWNGDCVHFWTNETTEARSSDTDDSFVYENKEDEYISFDALDKRLTDADTAEKKLEILKELAANTNKNRFAFRETEEIAKKGGLKDKFKKAHSK